MTDWLFALARAGAVGCGLVGSAFYAFSTLAESSNVIIGVDFGAPQRERDQRRKIIVIAAHATGRRRYRIDATGLNARLLANDPPGWTAKELLDELLGRPVRIAAFDFPFSVPDALLHDDCTRPAPAEG